MSVESTERPTKITIRPSGSQVEGHVFRLVYEQNGELKTVLGSREDRVIIGRSQQAHLVVDHESVSRIHCEVVWEDEAFLLRDLGSKAGTRMGSLRVREVYLPNDARIGVGEVEVSFSVIAGLEEPEPSPPSRFGGLLGSSSAMRAVHARLGLVAARDTTVLLEGESGTGKELVAQAIHDASSRRAQPFIVVDCGSIPRTLLEAELFGHERGAYTGASRARIGAFALAERGTS
jgi:transcriptional regulator of acetoin/glycerol metabolism